MNKIYLVNDYVTPYSELTNGINFDYFYSYIETNFDKNNDLFDLLQNKYHDPIAVWNGMGSIIYAIDGEVHTYDIASGKNDSDVIYLYTISPFGGASCTYGLYGTLNHGRSFYFFIPETTKQLIRNHNNFYLFINYSNEGTLDTSFFEVIYRDALMFGIPTEKIIFCISDYNIHATHEIWFNAFTKRKNIHGKNIKPIKTLYHTWSLRDKAMEFDRILNNQVTSFNKYKNKCSVVSKNDVSKSKIRPKKFLMLNRRMRPHRLYSVLMFNQLNIMDEFLISYDLINMKAYELEKDMCVNHHLRDVISFDTIKSIYDELITIDPKKTLDYEDLENVWGFNFENKEIYLDSYIHITSETNFFESGGYFSEKTWKPIGHLQPFIFMGPAHGLRELKKLGFKTFAPFINESYDDETDNAKRFKMIIDEIERLSKFSIEEIHEWYHSILEDVLIHNQQLFLTHKNGEHMKQMFKKNLFEVIHDNS